MRASRETAFAVVLGFGVGFLVAASIFFFPSLSKKTYPSQLQNLLGNGKTKPTSTTETVNLTLPKDQQTSTSDEISVSGNAKDGAMVVVSTAIEDKVLEVATGKFDSVVQIPQGPSDVLVTVYAKDGSIETVTRKVYYMLATEAQITNEP